MEPKALTGIDWTNIGVLVRMVWTILLAAIIFGGAFLTAHVFLPSLPITSTLKQFKGVRVFLYSVSGIALVVVILVAMLVVRSVPSIVQFYAKFWV